MGANTTENSVNLGAFSGSKPTLKEQPSLPSPAPRPSPNPVQTQSRKSSSSSSDDESKRRPPVPVPAPGRKSSISSSDEETIRLPTGHMTLKELNDLLLEYIEQIRFLERQQQTNQNISVTIDRSEIDSIHGTYATQINEWKLRSERAEHELANLRTQLDGLQNLQREIAHLRAELERSSKERDHERVKCGQLESRLRSLEQELKDRITILEKELANERSRGQIDISTYNTGMQGEYDKRLKAELKRLKRMYEQQMKVGREEMMRSHSMQISELEKALAYERNQQSSSGVEARELKILVDELRRKISDLEASNQTLGRSASEMSSKMQYESASYQRQISDRERELSDLKRYLEEIGKKYQEIQYGSLLRPEIENYLRVNVERERKKSRSRPMSRVGSKSSSSSSDEEKKKTNGHVRNPESYI